MAVIGRYEILGTLGSGAMGTVYRARDPMLGRDIALKTIANALVEPEMRQRFYQEARTGALLHHPNIVTVFDLGEGGGMTYIAMELLRGEDLQRIIETQRPFPLERKLALMIDVCRALDYAHRRGVVHRDIKPSNIFIVGGELAKVLDFGVARLPSSTLTQAGALLGTPNYMAPEQINSRSCDSRADLFALGIVFFEFLTGVHPFRALFIPSRIVNGEPESLCAIAPRLPVSLDDVLARALQKQPDFRYQSGEAFASDLERVLAEVQAAGAGIEDTTTRPEQDIPASPPEVLAPDTVPEQAVPNPGQASAAAMNAGHPDTTQVIDFRAGQPWPPLANGAPVRPLPEERPLLSAPGRVTLPPKPPPVKPRVKILPIVLVSIAVAGAAAAVFLYVSYSTPNAALSAVASAEVISRGSQILREPAPAAARLQALHQGDTVNIVEFPFTSRPEWVHVQRVAGGKAGAPGYVRATDLGNWSAVSLWLIFGPDETATRAQRAAYVTGLESLVARTAGSADTNRAYLRIAEQSVLLARAARESGQPAADWLKRADRALRALRGSQSSDAVANELRNTVEALRRADVRAPAPHRVPEAKPDTNPAQTTPAPYDPEPDYLLAEQDWQSGRYASAERRLNRILRLSPDFEKAAVLLQKVRTAQLVDPGVC